MNLSNTKIASRFIKKSLLLSLCFCSWALSWEVDLSRRVKDFTPLHKETVPWPSAQPPSSEEIFSVSPLTQMFSSLDTGQVIAILQTEEGFIPNTIRLRKETLYKLHIVNVNEKFKNASFILDSFGQSFGTYFGKPKSFDVNPKVEGTFTFISPETGAQGKIVVFADTKNNVVPVATTQNEETK